MKILHLNSNFLYTNIYKNQLDFMDDNLEHIIFNPRKESNKVVVQSSYRVLNPSFITKYDSLFTRKRLNKSLKYLMEEIDFSKIDGIHAHTLTNDGLLAYQIHKMYNIPFIITLRNTDINFTLRYKKYLKPTYRDVLDTANKIVFPNKVYKNKLIKHFNKKLNIKNKFQIIPNGIDQFWIDNQSNEIKKINENEEIRVLFIGRIYKNKNLHNILNTITNSDRTYRLTVIGKVIDHKYFNKIKKSYSFSYLGQLDKNEILSVMSVNDIFIMPSFNETFGLVYIEALSQNLPIIYTFNEGIYGYFEEGEVGFSAKPDTPDSIEDALENTIKSYDKIQDRLHNKLFLNEFDWNNISKTYEKIYNEEFR